MSIWDRFPDLITNLKECIALGLSAGKTAAKLSELTGERVTRNSVMGKANRSGVELNPNVAGRPTGPQKPRMRFQSWKPKSRIPMPELSTETSQPFEFLGLNIFELKDNNCRWIEGEVPGEHSYCGQPTYHGSWCHHHFKIVTGGSHVHGSQAGSLQNGSGRSYRSQSHF